MNDRKKKKRWTKIHENRLWQYGELAIRIHVQKDIIYHLKNIEEDDPLRLYIDKIDAEMMNIMYDMRERDIKRYW